MLGSFHFADHYANFLAPISLCPTKGTSMERWWGCVEKVLPVQGKTYSTHPTAHMSSITQERVRTTTECQDEDGYSGWQTPSFKQTPAAEIVVPDNHGPDVQQS
eukprot:g23964.t1